MFVFDGSAGGTLGAVQVKSAIFFPLSWGAHKVLIRLEGVGKGFADHELP